MKILITGATGFIGKNLTKLLLDKGFSIHCIVRKDSNISEIDKRAFIFRYDQDINTLLNYFQEEKFIGIIHLASLFLTSHNKNDISNLISSNITFGAELLEVSKETKVAWFINTGTFWQNYENEKYNPVNLYAATKEAFKSMAKYYTETSNLIFTTIKLNDTFGPNDTRKKVFNIWNEIAKSGEQLKMSEGEQIIDISYIKDVISAYYNLIIQLNLETKNTFKNKEFVVTNKDRISLKQLSKLFEEITNKKLNIIWGGNPYRYREVMVPYNKGELVPEWEQKYSLEEAIKDTIKE